jgi:tripartite-type tricarboxylate transporter receptor subunit TctC
MTPGVRRLRHGIVLHFMSRFDEIQRKGLRLDIIREACTRMAMFERIAPRPLTRIAATAIGAAFMAICSVLPQAGAQSGRPITIVVPYSPGTGPDILARYIGDHLSRERGQPVIVDNKTGASGSIGTQMVAHAAPDGLTLLMTPDPPLTANLFLMKKAPYDPIKDFAPVSEVATGTLALVVHSSIPADSAQAFVAYAKAHPGEINYASPGVGTPHHLMMEFLKNATGIDVQHIPFKDAAGAVSNLVGGHVKAAFLPVHVALPLPQDKVRIIAVTSGKRLDSTQQVPTLIEQGFQVEGYIRFGVLAPAGTPPELVERYSKEIAAIVRTPEATEKLKSQGLTATGGTSQEYSSAIAADLSKWRKVIEDAHIVTDN